MAANDKLVYFKVRARAEPIRMIYAMAGKDLTDERVELDDWPALKEKQPLGNLPVFTCEEGELIMSNSIARYAAKKLGLAGSCLWEETLNDMVMETCLDVFNEIPRKIYIWKLFQRAPEPEDSAKVIEEVKARVLKGIGYVQSVAEKRGKKFIIGDKMQLADVWLFCSLEFACAAFPDIMETNSWVKQFVAKVRDDESLKKYLADRPESVFGI